MPSSPSSRARISSSPISPKHSRSSSTTANCSSKWNRPLTPATARAWERSRTSFRRSSKKRSCFAKSPCIIFRSANSKPNSNNSSTVPRNHQISNQPTSRKHLSCKRTPNFWPQRKYRIRNSLASQLLQEQDKIIRTFPEVETVFGSIGRSDSATDNAPLDMYDTTLMLKPRSEWRPGMTYEKLIQEMDAKLQFPGLSNTWTMPVENRLDMELTGIKTPLGLKVQGPNLEGVQQVGAQVQQILSAIPEMRSIFAERVSQGFYLNVEVNRAEAARYGLTIADVQQAVTSGIGGEMVAENVEGRERYPVNVRYSRDFRDNVEELRRVLVGTPSGAQIPVSDVAKISFSRGPSMIRDEDGALTGYVYIDLNTKDYGGFVTHATNLLKQKLALPPGFTYKWSGEYEFELRAKERLQLVLPIVFFVIFMLLYVVFHSVTEAAVLIFPTIYALTGGLILQKLLGYDFSVAVWVGYIALFGIAVETGVVMVVYLHEALDHRLKSGVPLRHEDIEAAVIEGAVHRLRPKLMTVCVVLASLIPILWETGVGADVMKPIASPIVGGMITSTIHVLILVPVFFALMKERALRRGTLQPKRPQAEG